MHSGFQRDIDRHHKCLSLYLSATHEKSLTHIIPGAFAPDIIILGATSKVITLLLDATFFVCAGRGDWPHSFAIVLKKKKKIKNKK